MIYDREAIQNRGAVDYHNRIDRDCDAGDSRIGNGELNENLETPYRDSGNPAADKRPARHLDSVESGANGSLAPTAPKLGSPDSVARVTESKKTAPLKTGKRKGKTVSTKEEADWLKKQLPLKLDGASGSWAVLNSGAGFTVDFRVDKRQNNGEPINFGFPRISREMFLTLKGLKEDERKKRTEKYVTAHLRDSIECGNDKARIVAGKLRIAS